MRVIPTCIDERKFSGLSRSFVIVLALLFQREASISIFDFFTETRAISVRAKKPFIKVSIAMIINSIYSFYYKSHDDMKKEEKINYNLFFGVSLLFIRIYRNHSPQTMEKTVSQKTEIKRMS
jgi:hypothetical protein